MDAEQNQVPLTENTTVRRGLLAAIGAAAAAVVFKATGAKAAANLTDVGSSTAGYGVLASPGAAGSPILPTLGSTTHGVIGSNSSTALPVSSGVAGVRNGADLAGVLGVNGSNGPGVHGQSVTGTGVRAFSTSGAGIRAESDSDYGIVALTNSGGKAAVFANNTGGGPAGLFKGDVKVNGDFKVTGAKAAAVPLPDGTEVTMYCQESPEPYFEDFGRARLVDGAARVSLESEFASLVRPENYMVFLTPEGDSEGLFVSKREPGAFEVRESRGGRSNLEFTYRLVARRKDLPGERLARIDPEVELNVVALQARLLAESSTRPSARTGSDDA